MSSAPLRGRRPGLGMLNTLAEASRELPLASALHTICAGLFASGQPEDDAVLLGFEVR